MADNPNIGKIINKKEEPEKKHADVPENATQKSCEDMVEKLK